MNFELIKEIADEHGFSQIYCETFGLVSFIKPISKGRIRINFAEKQQIITLIIKKENVKGFHNFMRTYTSLDYNLVYMIFHKPNSMRDEQSIHRD